MRVWWWWWKSIKQPARTAVATDTANWHHSSQHCDSCLSPTTGHCSWSLTPHSLKQLHLLMLHGHHSVNYLRRLLKLLHRVHTESPELTATLSLMAEIPMEDTHTWLAAQAKQGLPLLGKATMTIHSNLWCDQDELAMLWRNAITIRVASQWILVRQLEVRCTISHWLIWFRYRIWHSSQTAWAVNWSSIDFH